MPRSQMRGDHQDRPSRSRRPRRSRTSCAAPSSSLQSGRGGPVLVEIPTDLWAEEVDPKRLCAARSASAPAPTSTRSPKRAKLLVARQAARDLRRPGRALGGGLGRAQGAGRAARHSRDDQPRGQERLPRDASAVARLRRPRDPADGAHVPRQVGPDLRHRLLVHRDQLRRQDAGRRARSSRRRSIRPTSTRTCRSRSASSAMPRSCSQAHARRGAQAPRRQAPKDHQDGRRARSRTPTSRGSPSGCRS